MFRRELLTDYSKALFGTARIRPEPFPATAPIKNKERFVVVNAFSLSATIDFGIINDCVLLLRGQGINVVFNQQVPTGVESVLFAGDPLAFTSLCSRSLAVISVRSGILDLAIQSISACLCFYPTKSWLRCWTLAQWRANAKLAEMTPKTWRRLGVEEKEEIIIGLISDPG